MINKHFLTGLNKKLILRNLQFGFRADWAPVMPPTNLKPKNFLKGSRAVEKARARFVGEVKRGRMLGGVGWSRDKVEKFLGRKVHVIPCGAVPKNDDPFGRIIHDYSYPKTNFSTSINSALVNTSVQYITFKERVSRLSKAIGT